ncbi:MULTISPECIES: phosphoribosylaminoimidazolesuccinocarboxamide synthase [Sporosarcina]|uniref:Phosphoribosylaminoimidazole-succinocarboxamide synthase n=2 Tax=Sporosarcina newyorkensis TaxID=759851 RepID=A0A1T4Y9E4_9BACL|nr:MULTISPECIES: phosphoribosylaminoimidazolesuccinocarboxamide synthase [Sporosarcina]EGQ26332.1 phosphoribosylaminoimidazole-succinocarboxamide synthase [Sporosarcina newyorkensis 2681]MBY0223768.1 phosphoribosylaminoimidazolesuccinocarboxamide synthase [Sporosarcina aquimarina]SKA98464.1 phosphoribosylaminoimidazole-succinocarboxamide synthase [Sporosarcina newyorkensis]
MKLTYSGKTKDVYQLEDGHVLLKFKDDVTGEDGVFDPGANTVGLTIEGAGKSGLRMTQYFFEKLAEQQVPTHYIDADLDKVTMTVKPATVFGSGLEVICRFRAVGSFLRRYGKYCKEGRALDAFVEVTLKDDERQDPPISKDALAQLGILTRDEYDILEELTKKISELVKFEMTQKGLDLYDIKLEFGRDSEGNIMLIDEISGGNMRVYQGDKYVEPMELETILFS